MTGPEQREAGHSARVGPAGRVANVTHEEEVMIDPQKSFSESGTSPPRRVTVTHMHHGIGHGLDADGREFLFGFGGDRRLLLTIFGALEAGQLVEVLLDDWRLIGWSARP
jgi:hypothetical protein